MGTGFCRLRGVYFASFASLGETSNYYETDPCCLPCPSSFDLCAGPVRRSENQDRRRYPCRDEQAGRRLEPRRHSSFHGRLLEIRTAHIRIKPCHQRLAADARQLQEELSG